MRLQQRGKRGAMRHGRWLVPALVLVIALSGLPSGPLNDHDRATLYRGGAVVPLPTAARPEPTATPTIERVLLNVPGVTVTVAPTATRRGASPTATATNASTPTAVMISDAAREAARARANASYAALWTHFYLPEDRLFREMAPHTHWYPYSYLWPLSQTLAVSNEMASLPDADPQYLLDTLSVIGAIELYFDDDRTPPAYSSYIPPPYGHENDRYYDDNAWIGLELVRTYEMTGYDLALERARQIFDYLVSGWHADEQRQHHGGVFWKESPHERSRNTVSTAPAAKLGLLLAEREVDPERRRYYQQWARQMYDWVDANLRDQSSLYWDHVRDDGTIDYAIYSYNQGAMIGASLLLYRATGDIRYLDRAEMIGQAALNHWDIDGLLTQPVAFNAIFFQDLLLLNEQRPDPAYLNLLVDYGDHLWNEHRDPETDLYAAGGTTLLIDQSAWGQIYAMLAGYGL